VHFHIIIRNKVFETWYTDRPWDSLQMVWFGVERRVITAIRPAFKLLVVVLCACFQRVELYQLTRV